MKFITKRIHAYLDYPVAISLMLLPVLLGLGRSNPLAFQISIATGIAALILTVLTDHHLGVLKVLSYKLHLTVDFLVGVVFVAAPFLFSFSGLDAYYYRVIGGTVLLVVSLHKEDVKVLTT